MNRYPDREPQQEPTQPKKDPGQINPEIPGIDNPPGINPEKH